MARPRPLHRFVQCLIAALAFTGWLGYAQTSETPTWTTASPMSIQFGWHVRSIRMADGRVLVANGSNEWRTAEIFDPGTNAWSVAGSLAVDRYDSSIALLQDGRVLLAGGWPEGNAVEIFDPGSRHWSAATPLNSFRNGASAVTLPDGRVLVVGGYLLLDAELYDPWTNSWIPTLSMAADRMYGSTELLTDGRVLVAGGVSHSGNFEFFLRAVEIFDPPTNAWTSVSPMATGVGFSRSVRLLDGRVLVAGSSDLAQDGMTAQVYDPTNDTWTSTLGSIGITWENSRLVIRPDGKVLAVGPPPGWGDSLASIYDPTTNAWSPIQSPGFAEGTAVALQLLGGQTLVSSVLGETRLLTAPSIASEPPIADAGPDQTLDTCAGCSTPVALDGSASSDPDGDQLQYFWREGTKLLAVANHPKTSAVRLPPGLHVIELTVSDWSNAISTDTVTITVRDPFTRDLIEQLALCEANGATLAGQIAGLQGQVTNLQSELNASSALNGQLTAQVADLTAQVAPLQASVSQLVAPGPQIASAIVDIGAILPSAPTNTARNRLESARTSLTKSGINVAAADLIMGLNQTKTAVSLLSSAPLAGMNTAPIRQSLTEGVHVRLLRTLTDVTTLVGSSHANVVAANGFLAAGDASRAGGDYFTAIEQYILAFKQLAQI